MIRGVQVGLAAAAVGAGLSLLLVACSQVDETSSNSRGAIDEAEEEALATVDEEGLARSGPGDSAEVDETVQAVEVELSTIETLEPSMTLTEAQIEIAFDQGSVDSRTAADGSAIEVIANSDDGTYIVGKGTESLLSRISVMCGPDQPGNLLVTDTKGRVDQDWVVIVDRLVPMLVTATGCESALLGSPTDCLDLPDDPAACIVGDGEEPPISQQ